MLLLGGSGTRTGLEWAEDRLAIGGRNAWESNHAAVAEIHHAVEKDRVLNHHRAGTIHVQAYCITKYD